jgi:uncharacterized protein (TIGR04255 family)
MSVQFEAPSWLTMAHLGAYWWLNRTKYPRVVDTRPISPTTESFQDEVGWFPPSLRLALTEQVNYRVQMKTSDEQWVCQIQQDRFVVNWRKQDDKYPRFSKAWDRFSKEWASWVSFIGTLDEGGDDLSPQIWELAYVNRIPRGTLWQKPSDWRQIFPSVCIDWGASSSLGCLQGLRSKWVWDSANPRARLNVELVPRRFHVGSQEDSLMLQLTARGPIDSQTNEESLRVGMNHGRSMIVRHFDSITSDMAKQAWRRRP